MTIRTHLNTKELKTKSTTANSGFGNTGGGRNLCFGLFYMAGQQSGAPTPQGRRVLTNIFLLLWRAGFAGRDEQ